MQWDIDKRGKGRGNAYEEADRDSCGGEDDLERGACTDANRRRRDSKGKYESPCYLEEGSVDVAETKRVEEESYSINGDDLP